MRIAILGASSQIAKDLICDNQALQNAQLLLYVRDVHAAINWLKNEHVGIKNCVVRNYSEYGEEAHEVVINFIGVGDPQRAVQMGSSIFQITQRFDDLVLNHLTKTPERKYIFLSSGAAYGDGFSEPVNENSFASININNITPQHYYAIAKLHAEARHRSTPELSITDIRVFNYFSRTQDIGARFLIADILRSIKSKCTLKTTQDYIVRDYIHPSDFAQLVNCIVKSPGRNMVVDCYSREPVDKPTLLNTMRDRYGLKYESVASDQAILANATGLKPFYYSTNKAAASLGYQPKYSSIETIVCECDAILQSF